MGLTATRTTANQTGGIMDKQASQEELAFLGWLRDAATTFREADGPAAKANVDGDQLVVQLRDTIYEVSVKAYPAGAHAVPDGATVDEDHYLNVLVVDGERLYTIEHPDTGGCYPVYAGVPGKETIDTYGCELSRFVVDLGNEEAIDGATTVEPGRYRLRFVQVAADSTLWCEIVREAS